jgi:hypothetical protein
MIGGFGGVNVTIGEGVEMRQLPPAWWVVCCWAEWVGAKCNIWCIYPAAIVNLLNFRFAQTLHDVVQFDYHWCCCLSV